MFVKKFPDIQTIFTDLDFTFSFHQILLQTVNIHVFIFNRLNYIGWIIHFSELSVVVVVCLCFSFGLQETIIGNMNKRFPDFLLTLPRTKISRYVFKIPWPWKKSVFPWLFTMIMKSVHQPIGVADGDWDQQRTSCDTTDSKDTNNIYTTIQYNTTTYYVTPRIPPPPLSFGKGVPRFISQRAIRWPLTCLSKTATYQQLDRLLPDQQGPDSRHHHPQIPCF